MVFLSWLHTLPFLPTRDWLEEDLAEHSEVHRTAQALHMLSGLISMYKPHSKHAVQLLDVGVCYAMHCCMRLGNPQLLLALGLTFCNWLYSLSAILCKHMSSTACTPRQG